MTAEAILGNIQGYVTDPANINIDLNQILPDGRSVIEAFVSASTDEQIMGFLATVQDQITALNKVISMDFMQVTSTGNLLFKDVIIKTMFNLNLSNVITSIASIDRSQPHKIDWNAPLFEMGNSLLIEAARLGLDTVIQALLQLRDTENLPLVKVNQLNDQGMRAIDLVKERIDNGGEAPVLDNGIPDAAALPMGGNVGVVQPNPALQLIPLLRNAGSVEPKHFFVPTNGKLDVENVHATTNDPIVARILSRLHDNYRDIDIDREIAELYGYLGKHFPEQSRPVRDVEIFMQASFDTLTNQEKALKKLYEFTCEAAENQQITEHNNTWNFKTEIAYIWSDAKVMHNKEAVAMTLADLEGCHWGQIVNLSNTTTGADSINMKDVDASTNEAVVKRILEQMHNEFPDTDIDKEIANCLEYIRREADVPEEVRGQIFSNLEKLVSVPQFESHNITINFRDVVAHLWIKAKNGEHEKEMVQTLEVLHDNTWVQILKICHIAELPFSADVIDFSAIHKSEVEQNNIASAVAAKLRAKNLPFEVMQNLLKRWSESHAAVEVGRHGKLVEADIPVEQQFIDGIFNEVFLDLVAREKGPESVALAYSKDFAEWSLIVRNMAVGSRWAEAGQGNDIYDIMLYDVAAAGLVLDVNNPDFLANLQAHVAEKGDPINLSTKNQAGISLLTTLVNGLTQDTPNFVRIVELLSTKNDLVVANWAEPQVEGVHFNRVPGMAPGMPISYFGPQPALELFYCHFIHMMHDQMFVPMVRICTDKAVKDSGVLERFLNSVHIFPLRNIIEAVLGGDVVSAGSYIREKEASDIIYQHIQTAEFAAKLEEYNKAHGQLDLTAHRLGDGRPLVFDLIMPYMFCATGPDGLVLALKVINAIAAGSIKVDWLAKEGDWAGAHTAIEIFAREISKLEYASIEAIIVPMITILFNPFLKESGALQLIQGKMPYPLCSLVDALIRGEERTLESYLAGKQVQDFLTMYRGSHEFAAKLEEYNNAHGQLDLTAHRLGDGRPLVFDLIMPYMFDTTGSDGLVLALKVINAIAAGSIKVDWLAKEGDWAGAHTAIEYFVREFVYSPNLNAANHTALFVQILSDDAVKGSDVLQRVLGMLPDPVHKLVERVVVRGEDVDLASYEAMEKASFFITMHANNPDFAARLEDYNRENGPLDLTLKNLQDRSLFEVLFDQISGAAGPNFEQMVDILATPNDTIRVDWLQRGAGGATALEIFYNKFSPIAQETILGPLLVICSMPHVKEHLMEITGFWVAIDPQYGEFLQSAVYPDPDTLDPLGVGLEVWVGGF